MTRHLWVVLLLLSGGPVLADAKADAAYARLSSRLAAAQTLSGSLDLDGPGSKSTYTFRFLRPGYSTLISPSIEVHRDGKSVWTYMPGSKQYMKQATLPPMSIDPPLFGLEGFVGGKSTEGNTTDALSEADFAGARCNVIPLHSKQFGDFVIQVYQNQATDMPAGWFLEMKDPGDEKAPPVRITGVYRDLRLDEPLEPSMFAWAPPKGSTKYVQRDYRASLRKVGTTAPDFTLKTPSGAPLNLRTVVSRHKATLLNFWFYG